MALSEFDLIKRYFSTCGADRGDVVLGVGDDCALLQPPPGYTLALTTDTLVEGVHFFSDTDPESLGHKALAVNLSDLAAMGAQPAWVSLALTLPRVDDSWLDSFAKGFCTLAAKHCVRLVGGDTTRGPRTLTVQAMGFVEQGKALRRSGAKPGDVICVSGNLGDAALALALRTGTIERIKGVDYISAQRQLDRPAPRMAEGRALIGLAHAAIDISDGLLADLGHVLEASGGLGASIQLETMPLSQSMRAHVLGTKGWEIPLAGGDDYELCFTLAPDRLPALQRLAAEQGFAFNRIGMVEAEPGIRCYAAGEIVPVAQQGYEHFQS